MTRPQHSIQKPSTGNHSQQQQTPTRSSNTMSLRQYMKIKHRHHVTQSTIQKQRQIATQQKIALALQQVDQQARAALYPKAIVRNARDVDADVLSSVTVEVQVERPPKTVHVHSMSPLSEVTNRKGYYHRQQHRQHQGQTFDSNSLEDCTNQASLLNVTKSKHSINRVTIKSTKDGKGSIVEMTSTPEHDKENSQINIHTTTTRKPLLSPKRQWELEPLQKALEHLALSNESLFSIQQMPTTQDGVGTIQQYYHAKTHSNNNANYEKVIGSLTRTKVKPRGATHSVLDLFVKQYRFKDDDEEQQTLNKPCQEEAIAINDIGLEATQESNLLPSVQSNQSDKLPTSPATPTLNTDTKIYTWEEDSNGAAWIIGRMENEDGATMEGSIQPELNQSVNGLRLEASDAIKHELKDESDSDIYDDSFYSEE